MIHRHADRDLLLGAAQAALARVDGRAVTAAALRAASPQAPLVLVAIGKAASSMTAGALDALGVEAFAGGVVVDRDPRPDPRARSFDWCAGGHPLPTAASLDAGRAVRARIEQAPPEAGILFLISGGASSLAELPRAGVGLELLVRTNTWLIGAGLAIDAMNRVRAGLSELKGGGLARLAARHRALGLILSDVPGDDPAVVGSGPLSAPRAVDPPALPDWLAPYWNAGAANESFPTVEQRVIACNLDACQAAAAFLRSAGFAVEIDADTWSGDAAQAGRRLARRALALGAGQAFVCGGETTVRLPPRPGRGGRNQHLSLAGAIELAGHPDGLLLALATDGSDGNSADAGALVDGTTLDRAGCDPVCARGALERADSGTVLAAAGDLLTTGPSGTNVMDVYIALRGRS
ncbi:MAG: DUF4147 domain-containing protein [Chromatiales bacterium]|nr:DUF4147 domain-containing protein [Chromatiales bacterium]